VSYPYRENLEVINDSAASWIRCRECSRTLCRLGEDWKNACRSRTFPPTHAGPLMSVLVGQYLLEKIYCPSCGALLDSEMVEDPTSVRSG
jgi:hypothetical protein